MVAAHVITLRSLLQRAASSLNREIAIECKHFFSGAAAYANGRIFMTSTSVGLALKLPEESREILMDQGAKALRYFPTGPIKKDYVVVPEHMAKDAGALVPWIAKSVLFSQISPKVHRAKSRRGRSPK